MQVLRLNEKQGFCTDGPVEIYDQRGLFLRYIKPTNFNLPPGTYTVNTGTVSSLEEPVQYEPLDLAPATKPKPKNVNITKRYAKELLENGQKTPLAKMAMDFTNGDWVVNPDWEKTLTTPEYEFATRHEGGHYFYDASANGQYQCDRLAAQTMLEDGFNPQQISLASHSTLCGTCTKEGLENDIPEESVQRRFNMEMEMLETSMQAKYERVTNEEVMQMASILPPEGLMEGIEQYNREFQSRIFENFQPQGYLHEDVWTDIAYGNFNGFI